MDNELIRPQVIENRRKRLLGEIVLTQSRAGRLPAAVVMLLIAALAVWAALAKFNRTVEVVGSVVSDKPEVKIVPVRNGIIQNIQVKEGDIVVVDQPLAYILSDVKNHTLGNVSATMLDALFSQKDRAMRRHDLLLSVADSERSRMEIALNATIGRHTALGRQLALQESLVNSLNDTQQRFSALAEINLVSRFELERRQQEVMMARQRMEETQQARNEAAFAITTARSQLESHAKEIELQLTQSRMEMDGLDREIAAISADVGTTIVAPVTGTITLLQAAEGRAVDVRFPLFMIRPEGAQFEVELLAPSRAVGFLKVGQNVNVMYDAFPYQKFGISTGTVYRVSDSNISPREIDAQIDVTEPVYKVSVTLDQQYMEAYETRFPLHGGMTVRASIILDRRSFIDWLLDPIDAVRGRL